VVVVVVVVVVVTHVKRFIGCRWDVANSLFVWSNLNFVRSANNIEE
jgi:hypothetical protein